MLCSTRACNRLQTRVASGRLHCMVKCSVSQEKLRVVVTGAAGKTGELAVKKLLQRPDAFETRTVVRSDQSKRKIAALGLQGSSIYTVDISKANAADFAAAFNGADALIIATSAVPKIKLLSLVKVFWAKLIGQSGVAPEFDWKEGQIPEIVDWLGQKAQIDAAKAARIRKVVLVSSMGGTQPDNALNKLGNGNILLWKRKAEQYLTAAGIDYTIIHPGGLIDEMGGQRKLLLDVDDKLLQRTAQQGRSIPREDVAELCVQCLTLQAASNRSFDVIALKPNDGSAATSDFAALLSSMQHNCDYTINSQLDVATLTS